MENRRLHPRKRTFKSGTIAFNRAAGISGIVKNISDGGAMLEVESVLGIPDDVTLVIEADHFKRECRVAWRQPTRIGVQFL
jgi:PilZ domain